MNKNEYSFIFINKIITVKNKPFQLNGKLKSQMHAYTIKLRKDIVMHLFFESKVDNILY